MSPIKSLLACFLICFLSIKCYAQGKSVDQLGTVNGVIRDSLYNHAMKSTTISIYLINEDKLLGYQVSNNLGEFNFRDLPLATGLKLIISNLGYHQVSKKFILSRSTKTLDFKTIYVNQKSNNLEEVVITIPPIQMNGDTLEFNAAAFKLDSNAVVQDLMKKIPNITQWGDGRITVNGREIKSLLVNGREFMGGDPKISIENIPKNALEKIQVYNTVDNPKNLQDSSLNMNLKLKKGMDVGYFGKVGGGIGTNKRFESDLSFNLFSPKFELSLVGASNNVNKVPGDINTLLRNSTYKGVGVQLDYMSDFRTSGINQPNSTGYSLKYDFRDLAAKTQSKNMITSEYFLQNNHIQQEGNSKTTIATGNKTDILEDHTNRRSVDNVGHRFNAGYQFAKDIYSFNFSQNINVSDSKSNSSNSSVSSDRNKQIVSKSNSTNRNNEGNKAYGFNSNFSAQPNLWDVDNRFSGFFLNYSMKINENESHRETRTDFQSVNDYSKNSLFNRRYDYNSQGFNQHLDFSLPKIMKLIFGVRRFELFEIDLQNDFNLSNNKSYNKVYDYQNATRKLMVNPYLTNNIVYSTFIYRPRISLNRIINRNLTNRFDKTWSISLDLNQEFYFQNNKSDKDFQNINRLYSNFLPAAQISYSYNQYGEYRKIFSLSYENKIGIPQISQIAPLTDSANVYFLRVVNLDLREEKIQSLAFDFKHNNDKKDNFEYKVGARYSKTFNNIIDNTQINSQNVRTIFAINNSDNYTYALSGFIKKAIKLKTSEIQLNFNTEYNFAQIPTIINSLKNIWYTNYFNNSLNINYTYKADLAIEAKQQFIKSFNYQSDTDKDNFNNAFLSTSLSFSYNVIKKLKLNTNISFSTTKATGSNDLNYNIWNASVIYRLLKGDNLEIKVSALDILHQNTSVVSGNRGGLITLGTQNVLQQYFILGVSYYPRKFGKSK